MENQAAKPPMLMVVEPDPLMLTGITAVLDQQGYRCFLARNHTAAKKATESIDFDLFILSIDDNIDAAETMAKSLRLSNTTQDVPIIFLAPRLEPAWIGRLNAAGGVYCLPKPIDPHLLIELVNRTIWEPHLATARIAPPKAHFKSDWVRLS